MILSRAALPLALLAAGCLAVLAAYAGYAEDDVMGGFAGATLVLTLLSAGALVLTVSPAAVISAGLALGIFSGWYGTLGSPIGIDRVVLVAGIAAAVVRDRRSEQPRLSFNGLHLLLLAIAAYAVLSALWRGVLTENDAAFGLLDVLGIIPFTALLGRARGVPDGARAAHPARDARRRRALPGRDRRARDARAARR